jgi:hypothetical protein
VGGHLGCSVCVVCHVVSFVFGCSLGPFPGVAQPYSYCRCLPLDSRPGLGLSLCANARAFRASVSLRVDLCVRVWPCVCLPIVPVLLPTGRLCFAECATDGRPSPSSWVRTSAGLLLSQLGARWCVFRGSFPSGFFSASWFLVLVIVAFHVCPGLPTVALWVSWPVLLRFCVGRSSSPPQCVSHPLLSVLHLARCASPRALLLGGSYSSGLVTCRCLAPARHVGLSRFVSAWPCPVKPFS